MKKVSLILTTFNCAQHFKMTMESILQQDYPEIEIVVKDGLSTDGTMELVDSYKKELGSRLVFASEKDRGIYDAMNKGFQLSTGEIIGFFNDMFATKSAVSRLVAAMEEDGRDFLGAHADLVYVEEGVVKRYWKMGKGRFIHGWMPGHPTLFLKRSVYEESGLYDISYKCSADYEFMIRALYGKEDFIAYVPEILVQMFYGGTSTGGLKSYWTSLREGHNALRKNHIRGAVFIDACRTLRVLCQFAKKNDIEGI